MGFQTYSHHCILYIILKYFANMFVL